MSKYALNIMVKGIVAYTNVTLNHFKIQYFLICFPKLPKRFSQWTKHMVKSQHLPTNLLLFLFVGCLIIFWPHEKPKPVQQAFQKYYIGAWNQAQKMLACRMWLCITKNDIGNPHEIFTLETNGVYEMHGMEEHK
jgi:hypothetical protein